MRQILVLTCGIFMFSTFAMAIECEDIYGISITGNNGTEYCRSNRKMNWWSALSWCNALGKRLFRYPEDCFCLGEACPKGVVCSSVAGIGSGYCWSSTPDHSGSAIVIILESGSMYGWNNSPSSTRTRENYALCR